VILYFWAGFYFQRRYTWRRGSKSDAVLLLSADTPLPFVAELVVQASRFQRRSRLDPTTLPQLVFFS